MMKTKAAYLGLLFLITLIILSCEQSSDNARDVVVGDGAVKLENKTGKMIWYNISQGGHNWEFFDPIWPGDTKTLSYNYVAQKYRGGESYIAEWWYKVEEFEQGFTRSNIYSKKIGIETGRYTVITWNDPIQCSVSFEDM